MRSHRCVILEHHDPRGRHFDWLMEKPLPRAGLLWTGRIPLSSQHFLDARRFDVKVLPDHRRVYLRYQGPIAGGRGCVVRADCGTYVTRQWTISRCVVDLRLGLFQGTIQLQRITDALWRASVLPAC